MRRFAWFRNGLAILVLLPAIAIAQTTLGEVIPHRQDKLPGPALSPAEAIAKMQVPPGFSVELVAAEPDLVNPVAMTIDERGRFWVCESLEYPRRSAGEGRDRIKILEDTTGDGRADKVTIFAEGLNIPCGIAVGHGGVWVSNAPDILFLQDTDGDGQADRREVVVTGFGRTDTHELPNSLVWGPDGWLYGLNGVFNHSHVRYPPGSPHFTADHPGWKFTCALFRIHPRTRHFELFAEGTSNPWGIAFNHDGEAFLSACVIDHLWHITQTGYYHRQGGPYPPHTWKIESIVKHKHQKAAYCGIHYFDSDAYPEKYRNRLYMGNIHGNCINVDTVKPSGATYFGTPEPDFFSANDAWFMPVSQKTGPDGCLYVLDWYDRYHCYQDANRDPAGIDRLRGRLYRIRYQDTPRAKKFDIAQETDEQLIARLAQVNDYFRGTAQRVLTERLAGGQAQPGTPEELERSVLDSSRPHFARMHALFALGSAKPFTTEFHRQLLQANDASLRAWGVRFAAEFAASPRSHQLDAAIVASVAELANDPAPQVALQVAIAARRIPGLDAPEILVKVLRQHGDDSLIPRIIWQNLQPLLDKQTDRVVELLHDQPVLGTAGPRQMAPYLVARLLTQPQSASPLAKLFEYSLEGNHEYLTRICLDGLAAQTQSGELAGDKLAHYREAFSAPLNKLLTGDAQHAMYLDAAILAATWNSAQGIAAARQIFTSPNYPAERRVQALAALVSADTKELLSLVDQVIRQSRPPENFRAQLLATLGRFNDPAVGDLALRHWPEFSADEQAKAIELLAQRPIWAEQLLEAIAAAKLPAAALNVNQARRIHAMGVPSLQERLGKHWGVIRSERNPDRELVVQQMRKLIRQNEGDPHRGLIVYKKLCAQCHKLHGEGQEVGPDITSNGRNSFPQLLSNVFDPSLVIGSAYQARSVITTDGRALTGLLAEEGPEYIVLKMQGGKLERLSKNQIDEMETSKLSMMPEGVEKQLAPAEIADLFALLTLDRPPSDAAAQRLAGVYNVEPRQSNTASEFALLVAEVAPGFSTQASGEGGLAILKEHRGRHGVLQTHPVSRGQPCVLTSQVQVPTEGHPRLRIQVSHHAQGDWLLIARVNDEVLGENLISGKTSQDGWVVVEYDLEKWAGQRVAIQLENAANDWAWEFGYWGDVDLITDPVPPEK